MGFWDMIKKEGRKRIAQEMAERETYDRAYHSVKAREIEKQAHIDAARDAKKGAGLQKAIGYLRDNVRIGPDPKLWKK